MCILNNVNFNIVDTPIESELDTLAQKGTGITDKYNSEHNQVIYGVGSCKSSVRKRPKKKLITQKLCLSCIDIAKENNELNWVKRYWNTWHCQNVLITYKGRAYGNMCKNRFCLVCVSIRKADMINRYKPEIEKWPDIHFLTLTVKAQPHQNLNKWMGGMIKAFEKIRKRCDQRHRRGKGPKLIGIRSLECNFNPKSKTYNPHFHILCTSKEIARIIKKECLEIWNRGEKVFALHYLQKIRKVNNTEKDIIETIKYGAKIFTNPTMKKGKRKNKSIEIYAAGLHTIYKAMEGHRLLGSFGFKLPPKEDLSKKGREVKEFENWFFDTNIADYVNTETGQVMTNYMADQGLENLLESIDILEK